jgi:hypothetical protein
MISLKMATSKGGKVSEVLTLRTFPSFFTAEAVRRCSYHCALLGKILATHTKKIRTTVLFTVSLLNVDFFNLLCI